MKASTWVWQAMDGISLLARLVGRSLMVAGFVFIVIVVGIANQNPGVLAGLRAGVPELTGLVTAIEDHLFRKAQEPPAEEALPDVVQAVAEEPLNPRMQGAMDYVSRRYHVAGDALQPVFLAVQAAARDLRLDPLLILAVIGVESAFNPFAQSVSGAQGLMQVIPRYHVDKLPGIPEPAAFFDPVVNVHVGARVLGESIRRYGGVEEGLQQFAGALDDPERRYAAKVLAERQRLEAAAIRRAGV
jgi:hypothetical protein